MAAEDRNQKFWGVRDLPEETRRQIKEYAAQQGLTLAEALEVLVRRAIQVQLELSTTPSAESASNASKEPPVQPERETGPLYDPEFPDTFLDSEDIQYLVKALMTVAKRIERRILLSWGMTGMSDVWHLGSRQGQEGAADVPPRKPDKPVGEQE